MMVPIKAAALLACLSSLCLAASPSFVPHPNDQTISGPLRIPGTFQRKVGVVDVAQPYTITLHLAGQDEAGLEAWLEANAGQKVLTPEQLARYISPSKASLNAVTTFLTKHGGINKSAITTNGYKNKVTVATTLATTSALFNATFHDYAIADTATVAPLTRQYTIPGPIAGAVSFVSPLASFFEAHKGGRAQGKRMPPPKRAATMRKRTLARRGHPSSANCTSGGAGVTATCLRQYYGTYDFTPVPHPVQTDIFVLGLGGLTVAPSDLKLCLSTYRPEAANTTLQIINVAGSTLDNDPNDDDAETILDTCTTIAATWPLKTVFYSYGTAADNPDDLFQLSMQDVLDNYIAYGRPGVFSMSYASLESENTREQGRVMCKTASHLAALGMTIVTISGDWGVSGLGAYNLPADPTCPPFEPLYPAGCPYVVTVGATQDFAPERVIDAKVWNIASGAGFSNYFARPKYQHAAVTGWMKSPSAKPAKGHYNASGRAYPDIVALGSSYAVAYHGHLGQVDGTSASTPTIASIFALLNSARRLIGKPNIGWANPALYLHPVRGTKDITIGSVGQCPNSPELGFNATIGWDPASGWGSPRFDRLRVVYGAPA